MPGALDLVGVESSGETELGVLAIPACLLSSHVNYPIESVICIISSVGKSVEEEKSRYRFNPDIQVQRPPDS